MHRNHAPTADTPAAARPPWSTLALLCVAQFMVILDITVANVALPSIGADLGFAGGDLQWVVTAYALFAGGLLLLGGRASDTLGRRRMFLSGLMLFTAASLTSGLAASPAMLVASRAAQGLGAAMLTPAALSLIVTTYHGAQRATALTVWGALGSGGAAAGVLLGGMLTSWLSWEWVFLVNVPVGLVTAALAMHMIPAGRPDATLSRRLNLPGALAVVAGLAVLVYALEGAAQHGWGATRTIALLALAAALLAGFAFVERTAAQPLVPLRLWRERALVAGAATMLVATGLLVGTLFLNSLYLQGVSDASALQTGLQFLPIVVMIGLAAHAAQHLLAHAGSRATIVAGLLLMAVAELLLAGAPDAARYASDLLPGFLVLGVGVGLVLPSITVSAMSTIGHEDAGLASGLMMTAHEIGAALGVAVLSAVAVSSATLAGGYGDALLVAAGVALASALAAMITLPVVRPAAGVRVSMH